MASVVVVLAGAVPLAAEVRLPRVFGSKMVLQRDLPLPVWGWADPGEKVVIRLKDNEASATADADGRWSVKLPAMPAGGPYELTVAGTNRIVLKDVLVGEVWVCSGQSNMAMLVGNSLDAEKEIAAANHPTIRHLTVPRTLAGEPAEDVAIEWVVCSPETVKDFSAAAYFFGRTLKEKLDVPIGLINTSWGGTRIEPWTASAGFAAVPSLAEISQAIEDANSDYYKALVTYVGRVEAWVKDARASLAEKVTPSTMPAWPEHPLLAKGRAAPTVMYNAMVHPLVPYGIRGAIWYQGEGNVLSDDGMTYCEKMKALVGGWRAAWGQGDFPFYYVQLAPWRYTKRHPGDDGPVRLPQVWEAQAAALAIPNTGMAVTTDIGNLDDIHPKNKQEVGRRLALWALAKDFGQKDLVYSGPLYKSMSVEGGAIRVAFDHVGGGLASRDDKPLTWFQIAGEDRKFVDAKAVIDGRAVVVSSEEVPKPVAVRFGWREDAEPNLMNKEGLPASAFRTDRW